MEQQRSRSIALHQLLDDGDLVGGQNDLRRDLVLRAGLQGVCGQKGVLSEQHQGDLVQILDGDRPRTRKGMLPGEIEADFGDGDLVGAKGGGHGGPGGQERDVQVPVQDPLIIRDASVFHHADLRLRVLAVELPHDGGKMQGGAGGGEPEVDHLVGLAQKLHAAVEGVRLLQQQIRLIEKLLALLGQDQALVLPEKQREPEFPFQLLDRMGQSRLGDVQLLGRPGQIAVLADRLKIPQLE